MLSALLVSDLQLRLIIATAAVFGVLFVANSILFALFFYKRKKSNLCTKELQQQRDQLLEELAQLRNSASKITAVEANTEVEENTVIEETAEVEEYGKIEKSDNIEDAQEVISEEPVNDILENNDGDIE